MTLSQKDAALLDTSKLVKHCLLSRSMALLLVVINFACFAADSSSQNHRAANLPLTQAMVNYARLDVRHYVSKIVVSEIMPYYPDIARLLPTTQGIYGGTKKALEEQRRVSAAMQPLLPTLKNLHGKQLQVLLLAIDQLAPMLTFSLSGADRQWYANYGIHFYTDPNGLWTYNHDYLWRAWKLDPESDLGKDAFLLLLETGFDPSYDCLFGTDNFLRMIHYGEPWLRAHPDDPRTIFVKFMLAEAYHTWWVLGHATNLAIKKKYESGSDQAYARGIQYYTDVITTLSTLKVHIQGDTTELDRVIDVAKSERERLQNKNLDFSAFWCFRGE